MISAVASATPSIKPTDVMLAPSPETRKTESRLWTSSDEVSMKRLTKPRAQTPRGIARRLDSAGRRAFFALVGPFKPPPPAVGIEQDLEDWFANVSMPRHRPRRDPVACAK